MGLIQSDTMSKEEIEHLIFIKKNCDINKTNIKIIKNMFIQEWNLLCRKWNDGKIRGYHFNYCTYIIKYLDDNYLNQIYNQLIDKWNYGHIKGYDFNLITNYLKKIE